MKKMGLFAAASLILLISGCLPRIQYSIISTNSGECLSLIPPGGYYDGDPIQQWSCSGYHMGLQASWQFMPSGQTDTYFVISLHSGKCLEVNQSSGGLNNGDVIQQSKCTLKDNQKWIAMTGQASTTIKSQSSGKCVQVKQTPTNIMEDGIPIEQWDCNGAKTQDWKLQVIKAPNPPHDSGTGGLCDACNPANPVCQSGALCMVMPSGQNLCGQACSKALGCPSGYTCMNVNPVGKNPFQCVPDKYNCP